MQSLIQRKNHFTPLQRCSERTEHVGEVQKLPQVHKINTEETIIK